VASRAGLQHHAAKVTRAARPPARPALRRLLGALLSAPLCLAFGTGPADAAPPAASSPTALWTPGVRDAAHPGRWAREFERRKQALRAPGPEAVLALLGLMVDLQGEVPAAELGAFLDGARRHREPLVASYAGYMRAQVDEARGELAAASAGYRREGYLVDWQIVGPFENAGRAGRSAVYAPETEAFVAGQSFVGKLPGEPLTWRRFVHEQAPRGGFVNLADLLYPHEQATGYATVWIKAERPGPAVLHLGAGGAYQVWLDGVPVGDGDTYRTPTPLQEAHALDLGPGWHRLLIKIGADEGLWGFYARISAPGGAPLPGLVSSLDPPEAGAARGSGLAAGTGAKGQDGLASGTGAKGQGGLASGTGAKGQGPRARAVRSLRGLLEARAAGARPRAGDLLALAEFYRWTVPFSREDRTAVDVARRADAAAQTARSAYLLAQLDPDANTSRAALQEAVARARAGKGKPADAPLLATLLVELSLRDAALGLAARARALLDEAFRTAPDDVVVELALAERLGGDGFPLAALAWVEDMERRYPGSAILARDRAERLMSLGRTEEALRLLVALQGANPTEGGLAAQIAEAHLRLGKADAAAEVARARVRATPGLPEAHRALARMEEARGDVAAARAALARAAELAPQDAELHALIARLAARAGDVPAAIKEVRRSLDLKPQQPELRDFLATLDTGARDDLLARYPVDLEALARLPAPAAWKGKDAGILLHRTAVRVLPNGLGERLEHRVIRILDDRGVRSQSVQATVYDPEESYVDVRRARVRRADGGVEEVGDPSVVSLTEAGYRMFYDQRQQRVTFNGLRPGDTLEVAFVRRDTAARNKFDDYFGELAPLEDILPQRRREYILEAPAGRALVFNQPAPATPGPAGTTVYKLVVGERKGIRPEPNMPGWTEIARYLHVSTFKDWDAVGRWYWNLVREQLVVDAKIKAAVQEVLRSLPKDADERAKVRALYKHVITSTRYVGLEFGIHGFKPYRTTDVFDRRFGDCKDKASLLKVMLAEAGIASHLVLVRTRDQGTLGKVPASLAAFNHAITYVPSQDLFLDGTAEFSGPDELPTADQGATVLIVKDGQGAELTTIPMSKPSDNAQAVRARVALAPDGSATLQHDLEVVGAGAAGWRSILQAPETRKERLTNAWGGQFPGLVVSDIQAASLGDVLLPVRIASRWQVPSFAQVQGDGLRFPALGYRTGLTRSLAGQAKREHDLVMAAPSTEDTSVEYTLPKGWKVAQAPASREIETPLAAFRMSVEVQGDRASVKTRLEYRKSRFTPQEYRALREFLSQVDGSLEQVFELRPER
jgi:tetratricopeptide (TPR) repeat protein